MATTFWRAKISSFGFELFPQVFVPATIQMSENFRATLI